MTDFKKGKKTAIFLLPFTTWVQIFNLEESRLKKVPKLIIFTALPGTIL